MVELVTSAFSQLQETLLSFNKEHETRVTSSKLIDQVIHIFTLIAEQANTKISVKMQLKAKEIQQIQPSSQNLPKQESMIKQDKFQKQSQNNAKKHNKSYLKKNITDDNDSKHPMITIEE